MKCGLPVIVSNGTFTSNGTRDEFLVKVSGVRTEDPGYELADNWTACNANFSDPRVPGFPMPTPTATCNTLFDCVYANEAHPSNASHGAYPTCYDPALGDRVANAEGNPIKCQDQNQWCPDGFYATLERVDNEGNDIYICMEENRVCDWGSDADGYENGCNTLQGIFQNREQCLNDFDAPEGEPTDGPPYLQVCCPFRFSLGGGFRLFFPKDVKVY